MGVEALSMILILRLLNNSHFSIKALVVLSIFTITISAMKWNYISHSRNVYKNVQQSYIISNNGVIFQDITRNNYQPEHLQLVHPTTYIRYDFDMKYKYVDRLFRSQNGDSLKVLRIYPACMQNINDTIPIENKVVEFDEGCFVVIQSKKNPADFVLKRTLDLFFIKKPYSDYKISWDDPLFEGSNYKANIIYQAVPLIKNDSITIKHKSN